MLYWRIYYDDGSTFDSYDGGPDAAPSFGVQAVKCAMENPAKPMTYFGENYYWWEHDDGWRGGDIMGLFDYLARPGWKRVLFGRLVRNDVFEKIRDKAFDDDEFRGRG